MSDARIRRFLLLRFNGKVSAVEHSGGEQTRIRFKGERQTEYHDDLWETLIIKKSIEQNQKVDFCLISEDENWSLPDRLSRAAVTSGSVWNNDTIDSAVRLIAPCVSLEIVAESGAPLCRYNVLCSGKEPCRLTARFAGSDTYGNPSARKEEPRKEIIPPFGETKGGLTDEEYSQSTTFCQVFVDENRAAAQRGKK